MDYKYRTSGVCASEIEFSINDGIISGIHFTNGCAGNLGGIATLCEGQKAEDILEKLRGLKCGPKSTSCPDQLSKAIEQALLAQ